MSVNFPTQTLPLKSNPCLKFATQILMFYFFDFATDLDPNRDKFGSFKVNNTLGAVVSYDPYKDGS